MASLLDPTTVRTSTTVVLTPERAFQLFTTQIGSWWDEDKHILRSPLKEMIFEPWVGGNIIDRGTDGSECRWARILAYEPPNRVCFSWDITTGWQIETDPARCSDIEITFIPAPGGTTVTLTHRHLDRHGPGWESMRDAVAGGWNLDGYAEVAGRCSAQELPAITDDTMHQRLAGAKPYTAVLLWQTEQQKDPGARETVWEHGRRNMALSAAGLLPIVLPASDDSRLAGIGVFTGSPDEVEKILADDPGVRAGLFTYEIHPVRGFPGAALG